MKFQFQHFCTCEKDKCFLDKAKFRVLGTPIALPYPCAEERGLRQSHFHGTGEWTKGRKPLHISRERPRQQSMRGSAVKNLLIRQEAIEVQNP